MTSQPTPPQRPTIPIVGLNTTLLLPEPEEARVALDNALAGRPPAEAHGETLKAVVRRWPAFLDAWARLGEWAYAHDDVVSAYAFFRVGYHRGLDRLRASGWRGTGYVPWKHEPNRGFLRSLHGLMLASAAVGEGEEARRCRQFLLDCDPEDPFNVAAIDPATMDERIGR